MATTVNEAFDEFMKESVNLDPNETKIARNSRDWLMGQLNSFGDQDNQFPESYDAKHIFYGSFSRGTKKRPLDDIDLMFCLKAAGCTYLDNGGNITLHVPDDSMRYGSFVNDGTRILNSKKLINGFVAKLKDIGQYKSAEIKRNMEAATLNLQSYPWVYDIVPCLFTSPEENGRQYYLIPDGLGNWKKTDPRLDAQRLKEVNERHENRVLNVIRLVKYWNKRKTMPSISSYLLENMVLDYFASREKKASIFVELEFTNILNDLSTRVMNTVSDPKNIEGNLNSLSTEDKIKISQRANADFSIAKEALKYDNSNQHKESIKLWSDIFGESFPKFK